MDTYVVDYIKQVISADKIESPDKTKLNGSSGNPKIWECLETLYSSHGKGGAKRAKQQWDDTFAGVIPDVAKIVNKPRRLWHIDELSSRPPQQWLIPGKILANGITVMYGPSEAGKSFLAVDYSAQISLTRPVIYIAAEGQSGYYARYKAWLKHYGHKQSGQFHLYDEAVQMLNTSSVDGFMDEARTVKPAMIVVDTLIRCFEGGDENQSKDVNTFTASCDRIRREFNCAVLIIHHVTKGSGTERGSGALRNNCDSMIEVEMKDGGLINVICSKTKDIAHWPTEYYRRMPVTIEQNGSTVESCVLEDWQKVKVNPEELSHNQVRILTMLADSLFIDCGAKAAEISANLSMPRATVYDVISNLKRRGFVAKPVKRTDPYSITEPGRYALQVQLRANNKSGKNEVQSPDKSSGQTKM